MVHNFNQFLQALNEEKSGSDPKPNINPKGLKLGSGGTKNPKEAPDVKKLQRILMDQGFLKTKSGIPTGYFGELTASALERYQKSGGSPANKDQVSSSPSSKPAQGGSKTSSSQTLSQIKPPSYIPPAESTRVDSTERLRAVRQWWEAKCGQMSERTASFISRIQREGKLKEKSFMIANKKAGAISLFAPGYRFVINSFFASGAIKDVGLGNPKTYPIWYAASVKFARENPKDEKSQKFVGYLTKIGCNLDCSYEDADKKNKEFRKKDPKARIPFIYPSGGGTTYPGVFRVSKTGGQENYTVGGSSDPRGQIPTGNIFRLYTLDTGEMLSQAVHGHSGKSRVAVAENLKKNYAPIFNKEENKASDTGRVGAGCLNVSREFLVKMGELKPSYIIILPDVGDDKDLVPLIIPIGSFQKMLINIEKEGKEIANNLYSLVKNKLSGSLFNIFK